MLKVWFGLDRASNRVPDVYFNNVYDEAWFDDPMVKEMVRDVDGCEVVSRNCIDSPFLGQIPPQSLSGGLKALICMLKLPDKKVVFDLIVCGDNCEKWIKAISDVKDVTVTMSGYDLLFRGMSLNAVCENDGTQIKSGEEWCDKAIDYVRSSTRGERFTQNSSNEQ